MPQIVVRKEPCYELIERLEAEWSKDTVIRVERLDDPTIEELKRRGWVCRR